MSGGAPPCGGKAYLHRQLAESTGDFVVGVLGEGGAVGGVPVPLKHRLQLGLDGRFRGR